MYDNGNHSISNLVAAESIDGSSTDFRLIVLQPESQREMRADHPNIVPDSVLVKLPLPEPPPEPPTVAVVPEGTPIAHQN